MGTPAAHMAATAEPVGVAALTRTSTRDLQDPVASCRRQLRSITGWLPPGWYIAAVFSGVESGAIDIEDRSRDDGWKILTNAGLPRDGGMADLLAEATGPWVTQMFTGPTVITPLKRGVVSHGLSRAAQTPG